MMGDGEIFADIDAHASIEAGHFTAVTMGASFTRAHRTLVTMEWRRRHCASHYHDAAMMISAIT